MSPDTSPPTAMSHGERHRRSPTAMLLERLAMILFVLPALAALSASAGAAGAPDRPLDRPLDREIIGRWINATEALQRRSDMLEDDAFADAGARDLTRFADIGRAYGDMYDDAGMRSTIREHGFDSAGQWGDVSARIVGGLIAIETEDTRPQLDAELAAAMRELRDAPDLPEEVRAIFMAQMQEVSGAMNAMMEGVREEDLPALRAMRSELGAVMELGEDADTDAGADADADADR